MDILFFYRTIGGILAGFERTIKALDALVERNRFKIAEHADHIVDLKVKNSDLANDSNRAASVARKLRELLAE